MAHDELVPVAQPEVGHPLDRPRVCSVAGCCGRRPEPSPPPVGDMQRPTNEHHISFATLLPAAEPDDVRFVRRFKPGEVALQDEVQAAWVDRMAQRLAT